MFLIVGLGNPDKKYEATRHNIGRVIAAAAQSALGFSEFAPWRTKKADISEGSTDNGRVILFLPNTGMNASGAAVGALARFLKIKPRNLFVVHDDADIALGSAKLSFAKRSAGHKGVESVIRGIKTRNFWRFRIGIAGKRNIPAEKLVLKKFTPAESRPMKKIIAKTVSAIQETIRNGPEKTMNEYNR